MAVSIEKSKNGEFYVRITGDNNEKLQRSETLKNKKDAKENARATWKQLDRIFNPDRYSATYAITDNTKKKP